MYIISDHMHVICIDIRYDQWWFNPSSSWFLQHDLIKNKYFQVTNFADNAILKTMEKHECRLTRAQENMAVYHYFMGAQKKSPYTSLLFKEYTINIIFEFYIFVICKLFLL